PAHLTAGPHPRPAPSAADPPVQDRPRPSAAASGPTRASRYRRVVDGPVELKSTCTSPGGTGNSPHRAKVPPFAPNWNREVNKLVNIQSTGACAEPQARIPCRSLVPPI